MKKLFLAIYLLFSLVSVTNATVLDENQCIQYATTTMNIAHLADSGATLKDMLALLETPEFKTNPLDIQILVKLTMQFVDTIKEQYNPAYHFTGAAQFCLSAEGNVPKMIKILENALGHTPI